MSNHNAKRRKVAAARAKYTNEPRALAAEGVYRQSAGLDWCKPEQRRFRALMALFLLNTHEVPEEVRLDAEGYRVIACAGVSRLVWSSIEISPQPGDLSILTGNPDHLVQCVATTNVRIRHGIPGLRAVEVEGEGEALLLRHLPTGGLLRFRYYESGNRRRRRPPWFYPTNWRRLVRAPLMHADERATLEYVPPMHEDAVFLLAGLMARVSCRSEQEGWAVGYLFRDDLPDRRWGGHDGRQFVHLWGGDAEWVLRWGGSGSVPPADVARALTHEFIGMSGATHVIKEPDRAEVRLGRARLLLEHHVVSESAYLDRLFGGHKGNLEDERVEAGEV